MKHKNLALILISCLVILQGCDCGCSDPEPIDDTEFTIAYKLVDGSWDTLTRTLPSTASFWVGGSEGTYSLYYMRNKNNDAEKLKSAVIDYRIVLRTLVVDTTTKKVDIIPDTLE